MAERLPLFPLGTVLFPGSSMGLHIFEPRYRQLVEDLISAPPPRVFGIIAIREGHEVGADSVRALYDVGCVATVTQVERAPDGRFALGVLGGARFRLLDVDRSLAYLQADVELLDEPLGDGDLPADATAMSYAAAAQLAVDLPERQRLLEAPTAAERLRMAKELMRREAALTRDLHTAPMPVPPVPRNRLN